MVSDDNTDIVMLVTPHIVRDHELTSEDVGSIYIGPQANVGLTGPPPLIAPQADASGAAPGAAPAAAAAPAPSGVAGDVPGAPAPGVPGPPVASSSGVPAANPPVPPGTSPVPTFTPPPPPVGALPPTSTGVQPAPGAPATTPAGASPNNPLPAGATPPATLPPTLTPSAGATPPAAAPPRDVARTGESGVAPAPPATATQIILSPPGTEFRVAGGPYTVPVSINNASRVSVLTLTVTYNPAILRVRTVQDGTFMRQGGVTAAFTPRIDGTAGRVDIAISRAGDQTGASGGGLLAALIFDAVAPGFRRSR